MNRILVVALLAWTATLADTVCTSGCDHTGVQACLDAATTPGDFCELRADTPGGSKDYAGPFDLDTGSGEAGNYNELFGRDGDCIRLVADSPSTVSHILEIDNVTYWRIHNLCGIGTGGYTHQSEPGSDSHDQYGGFQVQNDADHIEFANIGTPDQDDDYAIFGGWFYAGNLVGLNSSSDSADDGVHHVFFDNVWFQLSGSNYCETCSGGDQSTGDLLRIEAPQVVIEDSGFFAGGHNPIEVGEKWVVIRRTIFDNDWTAYGTGFDGYRGAAFTPGDQGNETKDATGDGLFEFNIVRNALAGPSPSALVKNQAWRGVFRFNNYHKGRGRLGLLADLNNGEDGDVSESKWYHITHLDAGTFWRISEPNADQCDQGGHAFDVPGVADNASTCDMLHEDYSFVNGVIQDLGLGDNLVDGIYIYNHDETDLDGAANGWKGREYRGVTLDKAFADFNIRLNDENGTVNATLTQALAGSGGATGWDAVFSNWDQADVTFVDENLALTSTNWEEAFYSLTCTGDASLADVEPVTTMVGASSGADTSGTLADGRFFAMPATHWDLGDWVEDDYLWIEDQRVQLTALDKDTGAISFSPAATWSDGADVFPDYNGSKPNSRCAAQDIQAPEPPTSDSAVHVVPITLPATAGTINATFTDMGSPVGAVILVGSSTTDNTNSANGILGCGMWSSSASAALSVFADDNVATTDTSRGHREGRVVYVVDQTGTVLQEATATGITDGIAITTTEDLELDGVVVLIGGTSGRAFSEGAGVAVNTPYLVPHGLGAAPDGLMTCYSGINGGTAGGWSNQGTLSIGFATGSEQMAYGVRYQDGQADGVAHAQLFTDRVGANVNNSGGTFHEIELTDRNSTSLEFTPRLLAQSGDLVGLAWNFTTDLRNVLQVVDSPNATGSHSFGDFGLEASAAILLTTQLTAVDEGVTDVPAAGTFSIYGTDFTTERSLSLMDENAADPTNTNTRRSTELWLGDDDGTEDYAGACSSVTNGMSCSFDAADSTTHKWLSLIFGTEAEVEPPPEVAPGSDAYFLGGGPGGR